jgi:hypothetical protein
VVPVCVHQCLARFLVEGLSMSGGMLWTTPHRQLATLTVRHKIPCHARLISPLFLLHELLVPTMLISASGLDLAPTLDRSIVYVSDTVALCVCVGPWVERCVWFQTT